MIAMRATIISSFIAVYFLMTCQTTKGDFSYADQFLPLSEKNVSVAQSWEKMEKQMKYGVNAAIKMVLPYLMEHFTTMNVSKECLKNSMHLISGLKDLRPWAFRFLDSSAKSIDGLLTGTVTSLGSYDECVNTEVLGTKFANKGKLLYRGHYCMIDMRPHIPRKQYYYQLQGIPEELRNISQQDTVIGEMAKKANVFHLVTIRLSVCVPSGCSREDVSKIAKLVGTAVSMDATASRCEIKTEREYTPTVITIIACYSVLGFLMLVGTSIDVYTYYTKAIFKSTGMRILLSFSLWSNFKQFCNTTQPKISCLNGIRVISMSWIILSHTYLLLNSRMVRDVYNLESYIKALSFQPVINATLSVETFLFMGGLLVSYLTIKYCVIQKYEFQISKHIIFRILRILPAYIFTIMSFPVMALMGSGPLWQETTSQFFKDCTENWWTNLIFLNNFYHMDHQCFPHAWYIACDFQLYIGSLLVVIALIRWPKVGISLSIFTIFACVFYSGLFTYLYDLPPTLLVSNPDIEEISTNWIIFYYRPFAHASSYFLGIVVGYLLITKPDLKLSRIIQVVGWAVAITLNMTIVYGVAEWNGGVVPTRLSAILYAATCRTIWTSGVAWMIICCATGHGGIINNILSWKVWIPLSRTTFLAYLIHPLVIVVYNGAFRSQISIDHYMIVWMAISHFCVSYAIAFCLYMLIELPFANIQKLLLSKPDKKEENITMVQDVLNVDSNVDKTDKTDNDCTIVPIVCEESSGIDNKGIIYKL